LVEGVPHPGDVGGVVLGILAVAVEGRHPLGRTFGVGGVGGTDSIDGAATWKTTANVTGDGRESALAAITARASSGSVSRFCALQ
jgi:hypothetical protein